MTRLYRKLSAALFGLFLLVGGVTLAVTLVTSHLYQREVQQRIHDDLAANIVKEELLIVDGEIDQEALKHVFMMMMVVNPTIELYLLNPSGEILAYSAPPGKVKLARVALDPVLASIDGDPRLPIVGDDPRHPDRKNIFSAAPIVRDGSLEGYLYIVLASEHFVSVADMLRGSYILRTGAVAVVGITILALIGAVLLSRRLTRRLTRLTRDMAVLRSQSMESDDPASRAPLLQLPPRHDEVDELRATFDHMAARIEDQILRLEDQDRLRREMVANVSHDLRTPLTHLHGYLETLMLKEESLDPEQRREYLEIALVHAKRLGRLVSDLFELAKLDALHEPLERERMPVGELVQDVAQKYRLPAKDRGVRLSAKLESELLWISADVGLIERALENVLDTLSVTPRKAGGSTSGWNPSATGCVSKCTIQGPESPRIRSRWSSTASTARRLQATEMTAEGPVSVWRSQSGRSSSTGATSTARARSVKARRSVSIYRLNHRWERPVHCRPELS